MTDTAFNILHNFEKPDKEFIKNKECLICLESIDIEAQKIVKLPCNCNNSVYHISCLKTLLSSGLNKNFCPHCKKIYEVQNRPIPEIIIVNYNYNPNNDLYDNLDPRNKLLMHIFIVHILSNSILNIINISAIDDYKDKEADILGKGFLILTFFKILINVGFIVTIKNNDIKLKDSLCCSYVVQTLLFVLLICLLSLIKMNDYAILLLVNNLFFYFGDFAFRIALEYRNYNQINAI